VKTENISKSFSRLFASRAVGKISLK